MLHLNRPLRIRIVQDVLRSGGTERQSLLLGSAFQTAGHNCALVTFRPGGALAALNRDLKRRALQPWDTGLNWFAPRLRSSLAQDKPDIVLLMGRMANCYGEWIARKLPCSVVSTLRTGKPLPLAYRRSLHRTHHVVANSQTAARLLTEVHQLPPQRVSHIPNALVFDASGPPHSPGAPRSTDAEALRRLFGTPADACVLLCVAMFRPEKNQRALVLTASRLPADLNWRLWLVGDGPARADCQQLSNELGLTDRIHFLGFLPDPRIAYQAADLAVLASRAESLSNFLIEAQAHGLPAIACQAQGVNECILTGETGELVTPDDPEAFASALLPYLRSDQLRAKVGTLASIRAREAFSPKARCEDYIRLFQRLASSCISSTPSCI